MPDKKEFIIFVLLCLIAFGLGYWDGLPDKASGERAKAGAPPAPTVGTNVVTDIVAANPQSTPTPVKPRPTPTSNPPSKDGKAVSYLLAGKLVKGKGCEGIAHGKICKPGSGVTVTITGKVEDGKFIATKIVAKKK